MEAAPINVRELRERLKWTQDQLAEHLGLDRSSVARMETGQAPTGPVGKLLRALADSASSSHLTTSLPRPPATEEAA